MILNNKFRTVANTLFLVVSHTYAQQVVTNTNANGTGSLVDAVAKAYAAGGNQIITFNISPLAASYVISPGTLNLSATGSPASLTLDATTQPGVVASKPKVVIRGPGSGDGITVQISNLTLKGLIIQNYTNAYHQLAGVNNTILGCWLGVDTSGTKAAGISGYGALIETNTGKNSVVVGSKTDFSNATRNLISGCGLGGIRFDGGGPGSYVGNCFIGTDITGTLALGNGTAIPLATESRHGVTIYNTPSVTLRKNLISANKSGGIDISGASGSAVIKGNKIGTDMSGLLPLGNRTFGIRIKSSNNHLVGGVSVADRNIISANGSDDYPHEQNTANSSKFDWYHSCGIYLYNSSYNTIAGNYVGVDSTGNSFTYSTPYDMGNFYAGLKIEGTSDKNSIGVAGGGNIIGGNGFRSSMAAAANGYFNLDGHGMIIKDKTTSNTVILANNIGIGANGNSKIGNKQDGISIQGATNIVVGSDLAIERNLIGDNTWGIFISSNYYDSQSKNCQIFGNYIGTNGTTSIGNGIRPDNLEGGGIGVIHATQGTLIGGEATGQGNVISGNRIGISLLGANPISPGIDSGSTGAKIYGNLIGLGANGTTIIPNRNNGIYISQKADHNTIGGVAAGQANSIVGNGQNGIYADSANTNILSGNTISKNGLAGVEIYNSMFWTVNGNLIFSNSASGISLTKNASGNYFFDNTIGDLTDVTKANKGDGFTISGGSSSNILGGINEGEGNIIANNSGNGIFISGVTSAMNSIHRNQIACNGLRGIELNGTGNNKYPRPTFSGTPTAIVVTGPTGSFIELFSVDACNNCDVTTNTNLQGNTLIAFGNSPLNFAGTAGVSYTATASQADNDSAHNTSEFSNCYSLSFTTEVEESTTINQNALYPNPFNHEFTIKESVDFEYAIYTIEGVSIGNGKAETPIQVGSNLPAGMYMVKIKNEKGSKVLKVTKE